MKWKIHLTFATKEQRNAWVDLIRIAADRMDEIRLEEE